MKIVWLLTLALVFLSGCFDNKKTVHLDGKTIAE